MEIVRLTGILVRREVTVNRWDDDNNEFIGVCSIQSKCSAINPTSVNRLGADDCQTTWWCHGISGAAERLRKLW